LDVTPYSLLEVYLHFKGSAYSEM